MIHCFDCHNWNRPDTLSCQRRHQRRMLKLFLIEGKKKYPIDQIWDNPMCGDNKTLIITTLRIYCHLLSIVIYYVHAITRMVVDLLFKIYINI